MIGSDSEPQGAPLKRTRAFDQAKRVVLEALADGDKDRSKKGSLDAPIVELVGLINAHPDFCTTSSCSGRIALFEDMDGAVCRKAGGTWLLASHAPVDAPAIHAALAGCRALRQAGGSVTLKQEPLVLHVECRDLAAAERLLRVSVASGFRESGINLGKKRVLVGIRTGANKLEAPLVLGGQRLLTEPGVDALVALVNAKFHLNAERTQRFEEALRAEFRGEEEKAEERRRHQSGEGKEQEVDGEAGPSMTMMTTTARQAKRREKALARRREKEAAKRGRKARGAAIAEGEAPGLEWREASVPAAEGAEARRLLQRWGHSLSRVDEGKDGTAVTAWLFGGYGYAGAERPAGRLNSLLELRLDPSTSGLAVEQIDDGGAGPLGVPGAREQHGAAVLFGLRRGEQQPTLMVFGGRASPAKPFGDLWRFDKGQGWAPVAVEEGQPPCPRWAHSMTALPSHEGQGQGRTRVVVYGGRDAEGVFGGELHVLSLTAGDEEEQWSWSEVALPSLPPLFLHTGSCLGESSGARLLLFGGMTDLTGRSVHGGGAIVSLEEGSCTPVAMEVGGRYAHAAAEVGGGEVWVTGGMPAKPSSPSPSSSSSSSSSKPLLPVLRLRVDGGGAEGTVMLAREEASLGPGLAKPALLHHATVPYAITEGQAPRLLSVGGGVQTFAFSPVFAPPLCLGPSSHEAQNGAQEPQEQEREQKQQQRRKEEEKEKKDKAKRPPTPTAPPCPCLLVAPAHTKRVKTVLERAGLFDKQRRIGPSTTQPGLMAIPILELGDPSIAQELRAALLEGAAPTSKQVAVVMDALASFPFSSSDPIVQAWADDTEAPPFSAAALQGQALRLRTALERVLVTHAGLSAVDAAAALSPAFLSALHVERLGGDVLLLEEDSPLLRQGNEPWCALQPQHLWRALLGVYPGATRVARMARVQDGPKRRSQVRLLYPPPPDAAAARAEGPGSPGWVTVRENGLTYAFDLERCMFSSGNVSEKERIGRLDCRGETVVDLYAGIGYYTLPIALHGKAARVVACEWNPDACQALRHNVAANGVGDRVEVLFGDNRLTTRALSDGMAHRVHLGLLPSSEEGWPIAARLLRPEGGWLHVHANVLESVTEAWVARVEQEIRDLGLQLDRPWAKEGVTSRLVRVKSFAPRIWHLVLDVRCGGGGGGGGGKGGKGEM